MRVIWKYKLYGPVSILEIPKGAKALHVKDNGGQIYVWFELDPNAQKEIRVFHSHNTGWPLLDEDGSSETYIGTVHVPDDTGFEIVWHVYERS